MTATLTIRQAARRLGVRRETALMWLRQHAKLQPVQIDRRAKGRVKVFTYCVPVTAVDSLEGAIKAWVTDPDHITAQEAATLLGVSPRHIDHLLEYGHVTLIPPPEGLPPRYWAGKYKRRVSRASVLAYQERNMQNETGT